MVFQFVRFFCALFSSDIPSYIHMGLMIGFSHYLIYLNYRRAQMRRPVGQDRLEREPSGQPPLSRPSLRHLSPSI